MAVITLGFGFYGYTVGLWRAPMMGVYVAVKMPLLVFLTLLCNGLLNGIFGMVLGSGLSLRQSVLAQLMSFGIAALVLGALAPVLFFLSLNVPPPDSPDAGTAHSGYLVAHTLLIAYAGVLANVHLARLLVAVCPDAKTAAVTLASWLAGNAFVGAQFSWILRPFFGSPKLVVAFLRDDPFNGTFYEATWRSMAILAGDAAPLVLLCSLFAVIILIAPVVKIFHQPPNKNIP